MRKDQNKTTTLDLFLLWFIHVYISQGQSHYNGRWTIEFNCNWESIPGKETLVLIQSPWMECVGVIAPSCSHSWFWTRDAQFCSKLANLQIYCWIELFFIYVFAHLKARATTMRGGLLNTSSTVLILYLILFN